MFNVVPEYMCTGPFLNILLHIIISTRNSKLITRALDYVRPNSSEKDIIFGGHLKQISALLILPEL